MPGGRPIATRASPAEIRSARLDRTWIDGAGAANAGALPTAAAMAIALTTSAAVPLPSNIPRTRAGLYRRIFGQAPHLTRPESSLWPPALTNAKDARRRRSTIFSAP